MIDVYAMFVQRLHIIILHMYAAINGKERERVFVSGAIDNHRIVLYGAINKDNAILCELSNIRSHINVWIEHRFRFRVLMMAQCNTFRHFWYFIRQVHTRWSSTDY